MKYTKFDAVRKLVKGGISAVNDEISYMDGQTPPSDEKIDAELKRMQDEFNAQESARKRQAEYPSIEELVVALYDTDDKSAIEAKRAEVKKKYPKP